MPTPGVHPRAMADLRVVPSSIVPYNFGAIVFRYFSGKPGINCKHTATTMSARNRLYARRRFWVSPPSSVLERICGKRENQRNRIYRNVPQGSNMCPPLFLSEHKVHNIRAVCLQNYTWFPGNLRTHAPKLYSSVLHTGVQLCRSMGRGFRGSPTLG